MFREGIPQPRGGSVKGSIPNGAGLSPMGEETISVFGVKGTCWNLWDEEFKVNGDIAMDALMCEEGDFVLNVGGNGKLV